MTIASKDSDHLRMLIIEDDRVDLLTLERHIKKAGVPYEWKTAMSLAEAKKALGEVRFDIIISDYQLGDGTALDVLDAAQDIPVIVVTGTGNEKVAVEAMKKGATDYIVKDMERAYLRLVSAGIERALKLKGTEEELDSERERLETLTRSIGAGMAIISKDYRTVWANSVLKDIFGEVEGKICYSTYNKRTEVCPGCGVREVFETGKDKVVHEQVGKDSKGKTIWSEIIATPIRGDDGSIREVLEVVLPITERKRTEEELETYNRQLEISVGEQTKELNDTIAKLKEEVEERKRTGEELKRSEHEWRETFDSISDFVSVHDNDFRFVRGNRTLRDFLGVKPEELVGKHCYEVFHGTDRPPPDCPHVRTLETRRAANMEFTDSHFGCPLLVTTSPILDEKGEVIGSVHIAQDITERKQAEEALREAQEKLVRTEKFSAVGRIASHVSHDIRNPLGAISNSVFYLERKLGGGNEKVDKHLGLIRKQVDRATTIVSEINDFFKGRGSVSLEPGAVNAVVREALSGLVLPPSIEVETCLADGLPPITLDAQRLQRVFENLSKNAVQAMEGKGKLTITSLPEADSVEVTITDTGNGIPPDTLERLFEPLFTTKERGIGMGLPIVKSIVEAHNGTISVESEPGNGTTFTVRLPVRRTEDEE